jgi:ribokinase
MAAIGRYTDYLTAYFVMEANMAGRMPRIVVIGPAYVEMTVRCEQAPQAGHTVAGAGFACVLAGAGVNQAVGAALCGCQVSVIAKVGNDMFAEHIRHNLETYHIDTSLMRTAEAMNTGACLSFVNAMGDNAICIAEGANKALRPEDFTSAEAEKTISEADLCLIHGSLSRDAVVAAIRTAVMLKVKVVLDPACSLADPTIPMEYYWVDILNAGIDEATGREEGSADRVHESKMVGSELVMRGVKNAVITMGRRGCVVADREGAVLVPAFQVDMVDKTCAGDAFGAALASSFAAGDKVLEAARFASAAGALACTKFGGLDSLPRKEEIIELLQRGD